MAELRPTRTIEARICEPDYRTEMALPAGKTCADCVHARRCTAFGFTTAADNSCDFHPPRFRERTAQAAA